MNFKDAYEKMKNGTATEEEIEFVKEEINKAKEVNEVLTEEEDSKENKLKPVEEDEIKKLKRKVKIKAIVTPIVVTLIILIIVSGIILGTIFGLGISNAQKNKNITNEEATTLAIEYIKEKYGIDETSLIVHDTERDLALKIPFKDSRYVYEIEIMNEITKYELKVDAKSKAITVDEVKENHQEHK